VLDAAAGAETIGLVKTGLVTTGALTTAAGAELTSIGLAAVALGAGGTSETCGRRTVGVACATSSTIVASGLCGDGGETTAGIAGSVPIVTEIS